MKYVNLTAHDVRLNNGMVIPPDGRYVRVAQEHTGFDENLVCEFSYGEIKNLPKPEKGTLFIVSNIVAERARREDVVAPATGHPEAVRRNGVIWSVPGFVRYR